MSSDEPAGDVAVADVETAEDGDTAVTAEQAAAAEARRESSARILLLGAAAFSLAALIAAIVFGVFWWVSSSGDNAALAQSREDVVKAGSNAVKAYTEVDYTNLDAFFAKQKSVSDDQMAQQLGQLEPTYRKALSDAKTKVVTTVQDIAVEELDDHEGKASFLAAVSTQVTQGANSSAKELRLEVSMTRVGQDWKLSGIDNVPLVAAGQ